MPDMTIEDVIEEARLASGARHLHVDVTPGARPEELRKALREIDRKSRHYASFSDEARTAARLARLEDVLSRISLLTRRSRGERSDMRVLNARLDTVFSMTDMIPDADLEKDIAWMRANGYVPETSGQGEVTLPA